MFYFILAQQKKELTWEQYLTTTNVDIPIVVLAVCMLLTILLSYILSVVYARYGTSLSNRKAFANNFVMLAMTTMLIITLVKSSLALSLGLVGALSIVRFRAAIKEPEELSYLFLCIGIGLGMGAVQITATVIAFAFIIAVLIFKGIKYQKNDHQNMLLTVTSGKARDIDLQKIINVLKQHCKAADLRRLDHGNEIFEALFVIELADTESLKKTRNALLSFDDNLAITFLDNNGSL
ncbi:MAG: DUF4956 domain-containing protein [Phycisphaerae bacterium]|nr:DUF4956 domain-containing protein [Phycisphaerae bacterium]